MDERLICEIFLRADVVVCQLLFFDFYGIN